MVNGRFGIAALVAALAVGPLAWAQSTSSSATGKSAKPDKGLTESMEKIHAANQAEIQMGQMAQQMGQSPDVKQYGEKLAADHEKNDTKLQALADAHGVTLTGKAYQDAQKSNEKAMKKLHGKQGADFDKAFMSHMVSDHKQDLKDVEKASKDAHKKNQTELASYLDATHTGLQGHLQEAERIEKELKSGHAHSGSMGTGSSGLGGGTGGSTTGGAGSSGTGAGGSGGGTGGPAKPGSTP
jgi:putative membrane protein